MDDTELADDHERVSVVAVAAPSIVCEYCLKSFTSGKAYGGHKRIHLQQQHNNTIMTTATKIIKDEKQKEEEPAAADAEIGSDPKNKNNKQTVRKQIIRCSECFRFFKSWKSLFGHMRTHPNRDWRGIRPPPPSSSSTINNASSSTSCTISNLQLQIQDQDEYDDENEEEDEEDEDFETPAQVLDLADSLRGRSWLSYDIRGRKAKIVTTNNLADDMNSSVDHLLMLADQAQNSSSAALSEAAIQEKSAGDDADDAADALMNPIPKKKMKVEKLAADQSNVTARQCVCSICNKSFPCYQALGGHMASHNKGVIKKMAADQEGEIDQEGGRSSSVKIEEGDHQCNICGLSFPTGQALGGHKKRHWWSPNKEVTSTTNSKAPPTVKKLEFDLNELPNFQGSD